MTNEEKNIRYIKTLSNILHSKMLYTLDEEDANVVGEMYVYFHQKHKKDSGKSLVKRRGNDNNN